MNKTMWLFVCFTFFLKISAYGQSQTVEYILKDKDVIPEGTAYNEKDDIIYIGSVYKQKVIGIDAQGNEYDVIKNNAFGILSPIGMEYVEDTSTLWVCAALAPIVNESGGDEWVTTILSFHMKDNTLIKNIENWIMTALLS